MHVVEGDLAGEGPCRGRRPWDDTIVDGGPFLWDVLAVRVQSLGGVHRVLDVGKLPHDKLQDLRSAEDVRKDQPGNGRGLCEALLDNHNPYGQDEDDPDQVQPHVKPPLVGKGQVVGAIHIVYGHLDRFHKAIL